MPKPSGRILPGAPTAGRLRPVAGEHVVLTEGFWAERQDLNAEHFLAHCDEWITRLGWVENFAVAEIGRAHV